jgi:hypothetical protein
MKTKLRLSPKTKIENAADVDQLERRLRAEGKLPGPVAVVNGTAQPKKSYPEIKIYTVADLKKLEVPSQSYLIEQLLSSTGAVILVAPSKVGKTLFGVQIGLSVASGKERFLDHYRIVDRGSVFMIQIDDPAGAASVKEVQHRSSVADDVPFYLAAAVPCELGAEFCEWLEKEITKLAPRCRLVILDSLTAIRARRSARGDIIKDERDDIVMLDRLAQRLGCCIILIHHVSIGGAKRDWDTQAAGTFAVGAAATAQIHMSRYPELDINEPARWLRVRGRHQDDLEMVVRLRKETLDYEFVFEGSAAALYPDVQQLKCEFGYKVFTPDQFGKATGLRHAQIYRNLKKLVGSGVVTKNSRGEYQLDGTIK